MHLEVTFRHMNPRPEIKTRADALFTKLHRFLDANSVGQLMIAAEHGGTAVELMVTAKGGVAKATEEDDDLRTALDRAFHRVEDQLRRGKEKTVAQRRRPADQDAPDQADDYVDGDDEGALA